MQNSKATCHSRARQHTRHNSTALRQPRHRNSTALDSPRQQLDAPPHVVSLDGARQELDRLDKARQGSTGKASTTASTTARRSLDSSTARQLLDRPRQTSTELDAPAHGVSLDRLDRQGLDNRLDSASTEPRQLDSSTARAQVDSREDETGVPRVRHCPGRDCMQLRVSGDLQQRTGTKTSLPVTARAALLPRKLQLIVWRTRKRRASES